MEIIKEDIHITECIADGSASTVADNDIIVPDTMPDMVRVLKTDINLRAVDKTVKNNCIIVSGSMEYKIMYAADDGSIRIINHSSPFNQSIDAQNADDTMMCYVKSDITHIECNISNSRKVNIKAVIFTKYNITQKSNVSAAADFDGDTRLPYKSKKINAFNLEVCRECNVSAQDSFDLKEISDGIDEILKNNIDVSDCELKVVSNKAVARGKIKIETIYTRENEILTCEHELPFSEILEIEGLTNEMYTVSDFDVSNSSFECDDDGIMNIQININVLIRAYDETVYEVICDTYSPDYELDIQTKTLSLNEMVDTNSAQSVVKESFSADMPEIVKVYGISGKPFVETVTLNGSKVDVSGSIDASVMYLSSEDDGRICCEQKQVPFTTSLQISRNADGAFAECDVRLDSASYTVTSANTCDLRYVLHTDVRVMKSTSVNVITDIKLDEEKKIDKSSQPGIIVYFVQNGDKLWDIAKRYHTTECDISEINKLDDDAELKSGQQLIIPKKIS